MKTKKLFITGGHLTPALATIEEIQKRKLPYEIVFIGRRKALEGVAGIAHEEEIVTSRGIRFRPIVAGRLQRLLHIHTITSLAKIPIGFFQALYYCLSERPYAVFSFGGYVALPVVVCAAFLKIPIITHEQTSVPGLANKIIAKFAKTICVTFELTKKDFPKHNVVVTGLPVRAELFSPPAKPTFTASESTRPLIYITGGSTGSESLNTLLFPLISEFTKKFAVIHQTGQLSLEQARAVQQALPTKNRDRYVIQDYFGIGDLSWILQKAAFVVGRSGANTVMEMAMLGKVGLFVPLPWSGGGEQMKNAQWLADAGSAKVIQQKEATPAKILRIVEDMLRKKYTYVRQARKIARTIPRNAAAKLVDELEAV
jgi:UDP-N-acetylglucosamine--N-acetylmuramyl-(pentapeptide) pyrophosphoryl-undecaprenol N-acetylglucosamine transferase